MSPTALLLALPLFALGQDGKGAQDTKVVKAPVPAAAQDADAKIIREQLPVYPLDTCPISGEKLGEGDMGEPINYVVNGRLVRLCCKGCVKKVKADPAAVIAKLDAAVIRTQKPIYPLDTCVISGEKLGEGDMGEPIDYVVNGRLVRLCCKGCVRKVKADPAAAIAKVDRALIESQRKTYPLKTCVISDEALEEGEIVDYLYGTHLVRFCCKGCKKDFLKDPAKYLAKIDAAKKGKK